MNGSVIHIAFIQMTMVLGFSVIGIIGWHLFCFLLGGKMCFEIYIPNRVEMGNMFITAHLSYPVSKNKI